MAENKPDATAALAQTQEVPPPQDGVTPSPSPGSDRFLVAARAVRAEHTRPYERREGEPIYRPLKIFTLDPSVSRLDGAIATLKVPYECLEPGPRGAVFDVDNDDGFQRNKRVDLDDPIIVMNGGLDPTPSDPRFHQQMVYAVASSVYATFRMALGRHVTWSFPSRGDEPTRLLLRPHGLAGERNAFYDPQAGVVQFGFYKAASDAAGRNLPGSWVFTCLSHDIVVHEVAHALIDGLRAHFTVPSNPDVLALHEAIADLVAVFQHFTYEDVLRAAIARSRADLQVAPLLTEIARQFSQTQEGAQQGQALRNAMARRDGQRLRYGADCEPHALGSVLVAAVFEAFATVFSRKAARYVRLATGGSGVLPEGDLSPHLVTILAEQAAHLASQFLSICIRAIDYCPPVDIVFGEYLRALITADAALVPDDPWLYREALVDAFRAHGIHPTDVPNLSEDALLWRAPEEMLPSCDPLSFRELKFRGDPSVPAGGQELDRQARVLGAFVTEPERAHLFGLVSMERAKREGIQVSRPTVQSIRTTRRVGPAGQVLFDLVAEVTQVRTVEAPEGAFEFLGGSTIVLGPTGAVRYIVAKGVMSETRLERQRMFMRSSDGSRLWLRTQRQFVPRRDAMRILHRMSA